MKEIVDIVEKIKESGNESAVLATVVEIKGSTYRRPGARMLVTSSGEMVGGISGGCLEEDVKEKAQQVFRDKKTCLVTYDMMSDDDIIWGLGLGCNGLVHVILEYIWGIPSEFEFAMDCYEKGRNFFIYTVFEVHNTNKIAVGSKSSTTNIAKEKQGLWKYIIAFQPDIANKTKPFTFKMPYENGDIKILVESIKPTSLIIFGAGFDAFPVAAFAKKLGWKVTLCDHRESYISTNRFPNIDIRIDISKQSIENTLDTLPQFAMVMTHNYQRDLEIFKVLIQKNISYIGMLGPKKRTLKIIEETKAQNIEVSPQKMEKIYGPAGLDIGSEIPEEIAIAIISEMLAVKNNRNAGFLRYYDGSIH